jgi:hypothetical protein
MAIECTFPPRSVALGLLLTLLTACSGAYYKAAESMGFHKRDILVHRVEKARDSQQEAKEQFKTALEKFTALTGFKGGSLEDRYQQLNAEFDVSQAKAEVVHNRITDIQDVAEALFSEWKHELGQYKDPALRRTSEKKLALTRQRYEQLITAMKRAEARIEPVLSTFRDQILFLKHNLNAQAIASLKGELRSVETDIAALIKAMEASIREANAFIRNEGVG